MFIVLEGLDGSGKSTHVDKLRAMLDESGVKSKFLHFPRLNGPIYGKLIDRFQKGKFGGINMVDPYLVALIYAGNRADAAPQIRKWLDNGNVVIVDRYVYSNVAFQCAKTAGEKKRRRLEQWILDLEYGYNGIPCPDISLFLNVPSEFTERILAERWEGEGQNLPGVKDIHEESLELQGEVRKVYLDMATRDSTLKVIDCSNQSGEMDTQEANFAKILAILNPILDKYAKKQGL